MDIAVDLRRFAPTLAILSALIAPAHGADAGESPDAEAIGLVFGMARSGDVDRLAVAIAEHPDAIRWRLPVESASPTEPAGTTAMHLAAANGRRNVVEFLIANRASVIAEDDTGQTPLHLAAGAFIARRLIGVGADASARDARGATPLHTARTGSVALILIESGAKVSERDKAGMTPLHYACAMGRADVAEILLQHKANPNVSPAPIDPLAPRPPSPVFIAAQKGDLAILEAIVDRGGAASSTDWDRAPLRGAVESGRVETVAFLIARGAELRIMSPERRTLVHLAAESSNGGTTKALLAAGLSASAADSTGATPLHLAAAAGNFDVAKVLLEAGVDFAARDHDGRTALDAARSPVEKTNPARPNSARTSDPGVNHAPIVDEAQREAGRKRIVEILAARMSAPTR